MSLNNLNNEEKKVEKFIGDLSANAPKIADKSAAFKNITAEAMKRSEDDISLVKPVMFLILSITCAAASFVTCANILASTDFRAVDALNFTLMSVAGKTAEYMAPDEFVIAAAISISSISIVIVMAFMLMIAIVKKTVGSITARTARVRR